MAGAGLATVLVGKRPAKPDNRTTALLAGSVTALETLGVWELCAAQAAPLKVMRIVDDTGRLWRAPEVKFEADEIDLDAFGYNIENRHLVAALEQRARALPSLRMIEDEVSSVVPGNDAVTVTLRSGDALQAPLVDRRRRAALAVPRRRRHRDRRTRLSASQRSRFASHIRDRIATPRPNFIHRAVRSRWCRCRAIAPAWSGCSTRQTPTRSPRSTTLNCRSKIEHASHSILGKIEVEPGRGMFPLSVATARRFADKRIALVGEAAHVIPPIGAQGLNLGLRDAATIGELAIAAQREGGDIGGADVLAAYDKMRRTDVGSRTFAIDLLNRTLLTDFLPVAGHARARALHDRPHRAVAPRGDARRRRAGRRAATADARRSIIKVVPGSRHARWND